MKMRNMLHSTVFLVFVIVVVPFTTVTAGSWSIVRDKIVASNGTDVSTADAVNDDSNGGEKKKGNSFARALGAPFRAIGRLFRRDKESDQPRRISQKEAAKFETSRITRVADAQQLPPASSTDSAPTPFPQSDFDSHLQKGRELLIAGDLNGSISELTIAASINAKSGEVNKLLGIAYEGKGFRDRALRAFEAALKSDENNPEHLNNLGYLLYKDGNYDRAAKYLKRAARIAPKDARVWNNLAMVQCQRGKFDDAYESFVKAVGEFNGHLNIAAQLQSRGYAKDATAHLEKAHALRPNSVDVLTKLVALYDLTGRPTDAETARRSLVALKTFADANK